MRAATEQLPDFIFYLGVGAMLLVIIACIEACGERFSEKRRDEARRRALRARAWSEIRQISSVVYDGESDG